MKAMQFNKNFPALPMEGFQNHYILVFDLTSLQDAAEQLHYPELSGESLRLEMFFKLPLEHVTEVIVLGERLSNVQIDKFGTVAKMFNFPEFLGYYKKIAIFVGFFIIVLLLSILCFFRPKSPAKVDDECCIVENPRNFYKLDCKADFNHLCPVHKTCVWVFEDSVPECM